MISITTTERARLTTLFLRMAEHPEEYQPRAQHALSARPALSPRAQRKRLREMNAGELLSQSRFAALDDLRWIP